MKTAVSIPEDVFKRAEQLARRTKKSRSQLFSDAVREYVARHAGDDVTEAMNRVCQNLDDESEHDFATTAARRTLQRNEW
jgi:metal-responsive CopG/Arc/MetJ family transcriptional regulator